MNTSVATISIQHLEPANILSTVVPGVMPIDLSLMLIAFLNAPKIRVTKYIWLTARSLAH